MSNKIPVWVYVLVTAITASTISGGAVFIASDSLESNDVSLPTTSMREIKVSYNLTTCLYEGFEVGQNYSFSDVIWTQTYSSGHVSLTFTSFPATMFSMYGSDLKGMFTKDMVVNCEVEFGWNGYRGNFRLILNETLKSEWLY